MESVWVKTTTDIDTVDWRGNPIHLKNVPAIKNTKTNKIRVYPSEVCKAEIKQIAEEHNLLARDVALLLMLYAKPGPFKGGEVIYKYHLNKLLFYQWKELDKERLNETLPHDEFEAAPRGPVPRNLGEDLSRLRDRGLIETVYERWGSEPLQQSIRTILTEEGSKIAHAVWEKVPMPFKELTLKVKERYYPLKPKTIRQRVHREYPEYRKTYVELDED